MHLFLIPLPFRPNSRSPRQLSSLPPTLAYLIALKTLSVEGNQLTDLPSGLEALADLVRLTLDDNPIDLGSDRMLRLQRLISNRALEAA